MACTVERSWKGEEERNGQQREASKKGEERLTPNRGPVDRGYDRLVKLEEHAKEVLIVLGDQLAQSRGAHGFQQLLQKGT